ncbi:hypothetical protein JXB02_06695 [Candidatus Woesearchaeota archaeon]|nr:hypothetical protein [Candidatus Woesearchaeota archaeon]
MLLGILRAAAGALVLLLIPGWILVRLLFRDEPLWLRVALVPGLSILVGVALAGILALFGNLSGFSLLTGELLILFGLFLWCWLSRPRRRSGRQ